MKYKLTLILSLSLFTVACEDCVPKKDVLASTFIDIRCDALHAEADKKGVEEGFCYDRTSISRSDPRAVDPDPKACNALWIEADKKCDALPPDPDSIIQTSGSAFYTPKETFLNGKWVKICRE